KRAMAHPVYFGSAITGAGVDALTAGLTEFLPTSGEAADGPVSGTVFKVERGMAGEKIAYARMFSGTLRVRDRLPGDRKVTAISAFGHRGDSVSAGQIGKLWGLGDIRIGDPIGVPPPRSVGSQFAPPTLETIVQPRRAADRGPLHLALAQLAEQDPLINLRQDDLRQEVSVSLYGE